MAAAAESRGRQASTPREIPARGWLDITRRVKDQIKRDRLSIIAAGVAFYALLAIFPGLVALVAMYGLFADPAQIERHVAPLSGILPPEAAKIVLTQLHDLVSTNRGALGLGAIAGLLVALWSASSAVRTLMEALNVAYDEEERRGLVRFYGTALILTVGGVIAVILAIGLVVGLPAVLNFIGLSSLLETVVSLARWPILALLAIVAFAVIYRYGPSRAQPRWRWVSWGATIAVALWIVGSALFSLYVTRFGNYNETYGAAGAVVILLMWFLLSSYAILIGAEINAEMERQTRKDTTSGQERQMGARRAYAADTVGE
ncbi:MAG TPA: YihY/virulence factor BrkB family protein [Burkholderiales bacterium]|nr:YihY/virulence factor BrkB family protein [Burkholderiales bacterium]